MGNPLQQTYEWFEARCGCLTASRAKDVINRRKDGKPLAGYAEMINTLIQERVTGEVVSLYTTPAMQWGIDHEDEARARYEEETGNVVELAGFLLHPTIDFFGASPDGLVGQDGLVEIKCPNSGTHLDRWLAGVVPDEYKPQMMVQLLVTGRKWVDFVDYDPRCAVCLEGTEFLCVRYEPSAEELKVAEERCAEFLNAVQAKMDAYHKKLEELKAK